MVGHISLTLDSAINISQSKRPGMMLEDSVTPMPLAKVTWPLYMTRPPMISCKPSPLNTPFLGEQMKGLRVFGGGVMDLPGITRTGHQANPTMLLAGNPMLSSTPLANGTMVTLVLILLSVSQPQVSNWNLEKLKNQKNLIMDLNETNLD